MIRRVFVNETGNGTSSSIPIQTLQGRDELIVQVDISATATVSIQGRLTSQSGWVELASITSSAIQPLARVPFLRFAITGNSGEVDCIVSS